jgi:MerC mercury resistance protein
MHGKNAVNKIIRIADYFGMTASALCLVHCLGMPLLLLLPMAGFLREDAQVHHVMVFLVSLPVLLALIPGFMTHRRIAVPLLATAGLTSFFSSVFLVGPRYGEIAETVLAVIGGAFLISAHARNRSFCRSCVFGKEHGACAHEKHG